MEKIIIRECVADDADAIFILNKEEMRYEFSLKETQDRLNFLLLKSDHKIFVAICNDNIIGYVHANDYDLIYAPHMKNIMGIAVSSDFKKMGIGRMLLYAVEHWAKETGACGIRLVSGEKRAGAHEFYRHCGYDGDKKQLNFKKMFYYSKNKYF